MSDSSYGSVMVEGVVYIDEREVIKRDAEIERLRHEVKLREQICADAALYARRLQEADDEIERLRAAIATWERACASYVNVLAARDAEIKALRDTLPPLIEDNERLRAQLDGLAADRPDFRR